MLSEIQMKVQLAYYDKRQDESGHVIGEYRKLWDEVFRDPKEFTDYYFRGIENRGRILGAYMDGRLIGMLHMNPYKLRMEDKTAQCRYIVGVAVRESLRRQGVMRLMMERAIADMKSEQCPIAFLMPKQREYYTDFGFETIYETRVLRVNVDRLMEDFKNQKYDGIYEIEFLERKTLDDLVGLSEEINVCLEKQYSFYALRDVSYLAEMFSQHCCQNGGVCVIREQGKLQCVFSYDVYDETMYVERYESMGGNTLHMLRRILDFAAAHGWSSAELTVPAGESSCIESGWQAYIREGAVVLTEGCGIMALALTEDKNYLNKMKNASFFDEIV